MKRLGLTFCALVLLPALITSSWAADVCLDGCTYSSIQSAIEATGDGGVILVGGGIYRENIIVSGKALTIRSESGAETTIIDGGGSGPVVTFDSSENNDSILEGFTIQNGVSLNGGGIICERASPDIKNCLIQNNTARENGGGLYLYYSGARLNGCKILSNSAGNKGGGVYTSHGIMYLTGCRISGNTSRNSGGGIEIVNSASQLANCIINMNSAVNGGGISTDASPVITNCTVADNITISKGGGLYCPNSQPLIVNSIFWGKGQQFYGSPVVTYSIVKDGYGGVGNVSDNPLFVSANGEDYHLQVDSPAIDAADPDNAPENDMDKTTRPQILRDDIGAYEFIPDNCRPWAAFAADPLRIEPGEVVNFDASGSFNQSGAVFSWDFGDGVVGSGITISHAYFEKGAYTVNLTVSRNCGDDTLTSIVNRKNYILVKSDGDFLYVPDELSSIQEAIDIAVYGDVIMVAPGTYMENIDFKGKEITVKSSQGVSTAIIDGNNSGSVVTLNSGETANSILDGLTIRNGLAAKGGGIYIADSSPTILHCHITLNHAGSGGGIYAEKANPMVKRTKISHNTSQQGGGVYLISTPLHLINCLVFNNTAENGGGIYDKQSSPVIINCTFSANSATNGNGIYTYFSNAKVTNTILWDASPEITSDLSVSIFTYCDILGGYPGTGNINLPPLLDVSLNVLPNSPLIDAGDPDYQNNPDYQQLDNIDISGDPRIQYNGIDIGAFEYFFANTDPTVKIKSPVSDDVFTKNDNVITISWTAYDDEQQETDQLSAAIYYRQGTVGNCVERGIFLADSPCTNNVQASYAWNVRGLPDGTNYNVCIKIGDEYDGRGEYNTGYFTIERNPPSFEGIDSAKDAFTDKEVDLSWDEASDISNPITYLIYSAINSGGQDFNGQTVAATEQTFIRIGTSDNGTAYYFVVRASDTFGNTDLNTKQISVIPTRDNLYPEFWGLSAATDLNIGGAVSLAWDTVASDHNEPITYNIYYETFSNLENTVLFFSSPKDSVIQEVDSQVTNYPVSGLNNNERYYFVVRAQDKYENEDTNTVEKFAVPTMDIINPSFSGLSSANNADTNREVDLSWESASDPHGPITYNIYRNKAEELVFFSYYSNTPNTSYRVGGLDNNQTYFFGVRAQDRFQNKEQNTVIYSATPTLNVDPPTNIDGSPYSGIISATNAKTDKEVDLLWNKAQDPNYPLVYKIYYDISSNPGLVFSNLYTRVTKNTLGNRITMSDNNRTYYFGVRAEDRYLNEDSNTNIYSVTPRQNSDPPSFGGLKSATDAGIGGVVDLRWSDASDPNEPITYNIYYHTTSEFIFSNLHTTVQQEILALRVTGLTNNNKYYFAVRAVDGFQNEDTNLAIRSVTPTSHPPGAIAFWNFDEEDAEVPRMALDGSGNDHHGTIVNAVYVDGYTNTGLRLDGNDYVRVPHAENLAAEYVLILDARIMIDEEPSVFQVILSKYDTGVFQKSYFLALTQDKRLRGGVSSNGSNYFLVESNTALSLRNWYRVSMEANAYTGDVSLYINEIKDIHKTFEGFDIIYKGDTDEKNADVIIGSFLYNNNPTFLFSGLIDEVGIYNSIRLPWLEITPPPVFSGLKSATAAEGSGTVNLSWDQAADDNPPITYNIYYDTDSYGNIPNFFDFPKTRISHPDTSCQVSGLTNGIRYYFVVRAENVFQNEDTNIVELSAIPSADTTPPTFNGLNFAVNTVFGGKVNLGWTAASDPSTPITYNIYYATASHSETADFFSVPKVSVQEKTNYVVSGLDIDIPYYFVVRASDFYVNEDANIVELSATPTASSGVPTGALAYWKFDEGNGDITFDETENNNDGAITGANWTTGKFGNALSFNGSSDYVSVANEDNFDMVDYLTIEGWINLSDSSRSTLASKGSGASADGGWIWDYGGWTAGQIEFGVSGGSGKYISAGAALPTGEWHHVVGVFNKDLSGNSRMKLFIDGVEQSETYKSSGSFSTIMPNNRNVVIGGRYTGNLPFSGLIDGVVIYNRALSASEVLDRYNDTK